MKKMLTALLGATFLASAAVAQTAPAPAVAAAAVQATPALWVVKDDDTTIYLFGTIHMLKPNVSWFNGPVKRAYDASSEVVLEIKEPDPATMQALIGKLGVDPDGPALTAKLEPATAQLYARTLEDFGIPAAAFEKFEPWLATTILSVVAIQKAGLNPESGVDKQLAAAVKRDGKTLAALETAEQQLGYFDTLPEPLQIAFMKSSLEQLADISTLFDTMVGNWAKGDPDALARQLNDAMADSPEIAKVLLADRNARWAEWIQARLDKPGTVFVAVGAGHLAGKDSVQDYLKGRKLVAARVPS